MGWGMGVLHAEDEGIEAAEEVVIGGTEAEVAVGKGGGVGGLGEGCGGWWGG